MYEFETNSGAKTIEAGKGDDGTGAIEIRKGNTPIKVWVTPGEKQAIDVTACNQNTPDLQTAYFSARIKCN